MDGNPLSFVDPEGLQFLDLTTLAGARRNTTLDDAVWVTSQEANGNPGGEEAPSSGADSGVKIDDKIKGQIGDRGWTEQDVQDAANGPPAGTTTDNRRPNKTADGQGRNDSATVYGTKDGYVVVNDRTREVVQVSDRKPGAGWIPDSRINWNGGN